MSAKKRWMPQNWGGATYIVRNFYKVGGAWIAERGGGKGVIFKENRGVCS